MARLVHLNGPPGIGKSTLSALFAGRNPGTLNLDVDAVHRLVGGWQDEQIDTWPLVWSLVRAMAATHLDGGRDVVVPQYHGRLEEIAALEDLARAHGADFRDVVLFDGREAAIERFGRRAENSADPWVRHHHRLIAARGGAAVLETMYVDLIEVVQQRPGTAVVPSTEGAVEETYARLVDALREPASAAGTGGRGEHGDHDQHE